MTNRNTPFSSRLDKRKEKKLNKVYNVLITVVIVLIVAVGATIFLRDDDKTAIQPPAKSEKVNKDKKDTSDSGQKKDDESTEENDDDTSKEEQEEQQPGEIIEETSTDPNIVRAYEDTSWKPVGTSQSGEHVTLYEQDSTDWNEMERTFAYATGIAPANMTTWYVENGGAPDKVIGTVSTNDRSQTFRVYIQWIEQEGWKPSKVEELKENDKLR